MCSSGVPSARPDGLGAVVAGSIGPAQLLIAVAATGAVLLGLATQVELARPLLYGIPGLGVGLAFGWWCVYRLGGITGDVLGACVEVTFTVALLTTCLG